MTNTPFRLLTYVAPIVVLIGCGGGNAGKLAVSGAVSYGGEPVKKGSITFRPTDPSQPDVSAAIADGMYQIPVQLGPKAEEYTVRIVAFRMKKDPQAYVPAYLKEDAAANPNAGLVPEQYIPKKHNDDSKLKVKFDAAQPTYDFKLEK